MIKLIAIDLDGTLLNKEHHVSEANRQALAKAVEAGIKIVICTGRVLSGIQEIIRELSFLEGTDFAVLQNGASIVRLDGVQSLVHEQLIDEDIKETALMFREQITGQGGQLVGFDRDHLYLIGETEPNRYVKKDAEIVNIAITPMTFSEFQENKTINKVMLLAAPDVLDELTTTITLEQMERLSIVRSQKVIMEMLPKGVTKATGLQYLVESLGLTADQVMAMGDQMNDMEMLVYAGTAVVMDNALPDVKMVADYVTLSNEESGVAHAIEQLIFK